MDAVPPTMDRPARHEWARVVAPALVGALVLLVAVAALLDWPRSEPEARHRLALRAAELEPWIAQELLVPLDRVAFAEPGGEPDAAPAWRELLAACETAAARTGVGESLPPLDAERLEQLHAATAARRFTAFPSLDALLVDEWPRRARVLASLVERSSSPSDAPATAWLDGAIVLAADLRATGLLAPAIAAADLENAVERRLGEGTADPRALLRLLDHAEASLASLPAPQLVAERESRVVQARVCMFGDVPPFAAARERLNDAAPWAPIEAAASVARLETYDDRLRTLFTSRPTDPARASYDLWIESVSRELPAVAPLLVDSAVLAPLRDAPARLRRVAQKASEWCDALAIARPRPH
jgi:hypothetical protein